MHQSGDRPSDSLPSKDYQTRNDNTKARDKSVCVAHYRCAHQMASFSLRRTIGFKLVFLSILSTFIVFIIHQYVVPNYHILLKAAAINGVYNYGVVSRSSANSGASVAVKRPPGVIIFGVSKCGTRAMLEYLKLHPDVVAACTEIDYFINDSLYFRGRPWYVQQMPYSREGQITVEKSPDYFQNPKCAFRISQFNKRMKLILLFRNPVERLISQYMQLVDKNPQLPPFEEWAIKPDTDMVNTNIPSVRVSAYAEHLDDWFEAFPRDQIHIVESKSLRENPFLEMKRVETFLNLRSYYELSDFFFNNTRGFYCPLNRLTGKTKCLGKTKGREHIPVENRVRQILHSYFEPYNAKLNEMLGYKFTWS